jgi:hypothetical protein
MSPLPEGTFAVAERTVWCMYAYPRPLSYRDLDAGGSALRGRGDRQERLGGLLSLLPEGNLKLFAISPGQTRSSFGTGRGECRPRRMQSMTA